MDGAAEILSLPPIAKPPITPVEPATGSAPAPVALNLGYEAKEKPPNLYEKLVPQIKLAIDSAAKLWADYQKYQYMKMSDPRTILQRQARRHELFSLREGLLWRALGKTATRGIVIGAIGLAATTTTVAGFLDRTNPDIADLLSRHNEAQTSLILDGDGNFVQEIVAPDLGRRTEVGLGNISPRLIDATVATEDKYYWGNWMKDLGYGVSRVIWRLIKERKIDSGGSTITQQVARNSYDLYYLFDKSKEVGGQAGKFVRKLREIVLAAEINRNYSKNEVMELYLNNNYYGYGAYGVEAASQTYFGKNAKDLTLMEAAFLAGKTQGPELYDPYNSRPAVNDRIRQVLTYVKKNYGAQSCTGVTGKACYSYQEIDNAVKEIESYQFKAPPQIYDHPAWVDMVEGQLHDLFPGDSFYTAGVNVTTTIDSSAQKGLDEALSATVSTDSVVVWGQDGAIQAIGGDAFPTQITIRTPDGDYNLLELADSFEWARGNKVNLHAINKISKIANGKVVLENPPFLKSSVESSIEVDQLSIGENVTLPDGSSVMLGSSSSTDGIRYNWIIGEKDGRNFIYWTSDKDPQTALITFQNITTQINSAPKLDRSELSPVPVNSSLYLDKSPDGTIRFSERVDLITDEKLVGPYIKPQMIIVHWDGNEDKDQSTWLSTTTRNGLVGGWGDSATFAVGVDGPLQLVKMNETQVQSTSASTGRNDIAINIEMSGSAFDENPPPETEISYTVDLIAKLLLQYHLDIDQVRGHYEEDTTIEVSPKVYIAAPEGDPKAFDWHKPDPGEKFLADLKKRIEIRMKELQGKAGTTASSVQRAQMKAPQPEADLFLPASIDIRRNDKTDGYEYYDPSKGSFITGKEVWEAIRLERNVGIPSVITRNLDAEHQARQSQLAAMRNNPHAIKQARASGNAQINKAQRETRANIPRDRGRT